MGPVENDCESLRGCETPSCAAISCRTLSRLARPHDVLYPFYAASSSLRDVIPEIDIWRVANLMLKRYDDPALVESARRADEIAAADDTVGAAVWCRIIDASISSRIRHLPGRCTDAGDLLLASFRCSLGTDGMSGRPCNATSPTDGYRSAGAAGLTGPTPMVPATP